MHYTPVVYSPSGTAINNAVWTGASYQTVVKDSNGNYVSSSSVSSTETDWTDSVGRTALRVVQTGAGSTLTEVDYHYEDSAGTDREYQLKYQNYNIQTNFGCYPIFEYAQNNVPLPYELDLPNGQKYSFTYEGTPSSPGYFTGRLHQVQVPAGGTYTYTYGTTNDGINCDDGTVISMTRSVGDGTTTATWTYGRATSGSNWLTTTTAPQMPYDSAANQSVYTFNSNSQETSETYYQGSVGGAPIRTVNTTWAANNTPLTHVTILEDGSTQAETDTNFDDYGNPTQVKEYDFGSGSHGSLIRTITNTFLSASAYTSRNIMNRLTERTISDAAGVLQYRQDISYDGSSLTCITGASQHDDTNFGCGFTTRGLPTSITNYAAPSGPSGGVTTTRAYDIFGNLRTVAVAGVQQTSASFSSATNWFAPDSMTAGPSTGPQLTASATYNPYTGAPVSATDPNGNTSIYSYDLIGRPIAVTRPDATQFTTSYDDVNFKVTSVMPIDSSDAEKQVTAYDKFGRVSTVSTEDASGTVYAVVETLYDPVSRSYKTSNPYTNTPSYWTESRFDALGRLAKTILPDGAASTISYSTTCSIATDPSSRQQKRCSDAGGRVVAVYEPDVTNGNVLTVPTTYSYTVLDALSGVTEGVQSRAYTHDGLGQITAIAIPEAGTSNYQYNNFGEVSQRTDARGVITNYSYDSLNRLSQVAYNVGSTGVTNPGTITYSFGTTPSSYNNGLLISMTDGTGSESYTYDVLGRVKTMSKVIGSATYALSYAYNAAGELTSTTYPSGRVVVQSYDALGRLCAVSPAGGSCAPSLSYANAMSYNTAQQLVGFNYGNGIAASFGYSADRLQLTGLSYATSSAFLFGLSYGYTSGQANNGQITNISDNSAYGRSISYSYDALNRLSTAATVGDEWWPAWGMQMIYDRYGNRTQQNQTGGSVPAPCLAVSTSTNQITGTCSAPGGFSYDANGNMTNDGQNTLAYDAENHTTTANSTNTYSYDANGDRVQKVSAGNTTQYVYSGSKVIAEYDGSQNLKIEYIYSGNTLLASTWNLTNPGFENGLSGWNTWGTGSVTVQKDPPNAHSGNDYLQITTSSNAGASFGQLIPVYSQEQFTAGGWVNLVSGAAGWVNWEVNYYDANYNYVSTTSCYPGKPSSTGTWTYESLLFGVPSNVAYVQLVAQVWGASGTVVANFDDAFITANGTTYYLRDHLSARVSTDVNANIIGAQGHFPFGEQWYVQTSATKWQFTSYERDSETGNDYAQARYHINRLGRFSSPDPLAGNIGDPQSLNRYSYSGNSPITSFDPAGRQCEPTVRNDFKKDDRPVAVAPPDSNAGHDDPDSNDDEISVSNGSADLPQMSYVPPCDSGGLGGGTVSLDGADVPVTVAFAGGGITWGTGAGASSQGMGGAMVAIWLPADTIDVGVNTQMSGQQLSSDTYNYHQDAGFYDFFYVGGYLSDPASPDSPASSPLSAAYAPGNWYPGQNGPQIYEQYKTYPRPTPSGPPEPTPVQTPPPAFQPPPPGGITPTSEPLPPTVPPDLPVNSSQFWKMLTYILVKGTTMFPSPSIPFLLTPQGTVDNFVQTGKAQKCPGSAGCA